MLFSSLDFVFPALEYTSPKIEQQSGDSSKLNILLSLSKSLKKKSALHFLAWLQWLTSWIFGTIALSSQNIQTPD